MAFISIQSVCSLQPAIFLLLEGAELPGAGPPPSPRRPWRTWRGEHRRLTTPSMVK